MNTLSINQMERIEGASLPNRGCTSPINFLLIPGILTWAATSLANCLAEDDPIWEDAAPPCCFA